MHNVKTTARTLLPLRYGDLLISAVAAALRLLTTGLPSGVGNQSLHIVLIEHLRHPEMFRGDLLLETLPRFPTWFFHVFAWALPDAVPTAAALAVAHVIATWLLFAATVALVRGIWPDVRSPALILIPMVALSLSGLAESPLNPLAFSHTSLAFALSLIALNALVRGRIFSALALIGALCNIHLLTAAYTAALTVMWCAWNIKSLPIQRTLAGVLAACVLSLPVIPFLLPAAGGFDAEWVELLSMRSAHHVFGSSWWMPGDPSVAGFALWAGWAAVARGLIGGKHRHTDPWLAAAALLMTVGWLGTDVFPTPLIMRAQLFRVSGYVVLTALLLATRAVDMHIIRTGPTPALRRLSRCAMLLMAAVLFLPAGRMLQAPALLIAASIACAYKKLSPPEALAAAAAIVIVTLSDIHLKTGLWMPSLPSLPAPSAGLFPAAVVALACAPYARTVARTGLIAASLLLLTAGLVTREGAHRGTGCWEDIQQQTRLRTPSDALILTPPRRNGFRLGSHRAVVGEWRDGTQQFFDPAFAAEWARRMRSLDADRTRSFDAEDWIREARTWGADYLVLPLDERLRLVRVAENDTWMLCRPEQPPPPPLPAPPEQAIDPDDWLEQERFMVEVVEPNLKRHRRTTVELRLLDPAGRPLPGTRVEVQQIGMDFHIGSSLNHFAAPAGHSHEFRAPLVHEKELEHFLRVFNYSVIPYSGKWVVIEPQEGQRNLEPLDRYVEWGTQHGIAIEFHFVTGYPPRWLSDRPREQQQQALLRHAGDLIARYGDRITLWQIVNENHLQNLAAPVFELFRRKLPDARLAVSHCARFYSAREGERRMRELLRGWDSAEQLQRQGVAIDFFAVHAHRPFNVWCDPRTIYEVLDAFEERGMRVRISEAGISHTGRIVGSVMAGEWTEELQAEYLRRFLTVLFSHPNVDGVNFWGFGPRTWQPHIGLLDEHYEPRPAFRELDRLVNHQWRTHQHLETGSSGRVRFTGFHGPYRITARLPDGREASTTIGIGARTPGEKDVVLPLDP